MHRLTLEYLNYIWSNFYILNRNILFSFTNIFFEKIKNQNLLSSPIFK